MFLSEKIEAIIPVPAGEYMTWILSDSRGLKGPGNYEISFEISIDESFLEIEMLYTNFTIVRIQPILELFTNKFAYNLEDDVILTFKNRGPEGVPVELPNGVPFEIEYDNMETGQPITYSLPVIENLISVSANESVQWTLSYDQDTLKGSGFYKIDFKVKVGYYIDHLFTRFSIGLLSSELFTDKDHYTEGENVVLTLGNQGSTPVKTRPWFFIVYREVQNSPSTYLGPPPRSFVTEIILQPGEIITWNITNIMKGPGFYTVTSKFWRAETSIYVQTEFEIISDTSTKTYAWFVPGFEILTTILAIIAMYALNLLNINISRLNY